MTSRARVLVASPVVWGLVLGAVLGAVLAACASRPSMMPAAELELRQKEIQDYWMQIRQWRVERGWSAEPVPPRPEERAVTPATRKCETTREPSTDTCQDTCNLKDAICDNAESICRIAKQLENDGWADGKCRSARASCAEARQRCCECTVSEQASAAPVREGKP
jgi:hypothetical protein